jgi:carbon monoxide dehydrogenase subunit G
MKQRLFWTISIVSLISFSSSAQVNWKLVQEEDGIKVYTKHESGSEYKAFKAEMKVSCKIENIVEVLKNSESINNWIVNCKGVKLLKTDNNNQYYYIETSLPFPFKNRDMVYHFQFIEIDSRQVKVTVTGMPEYIPTKEGIVRLTKANGYWLLNSIDATTTAVTYQMHVEPGGLIPAWLANPFIVNVPLSTFKELRKIIQK